MLNVFVLGVIVTVAPEVTPAERTAVSIVTFSESIAVTTTPAVARPVAVKTSPTYRFEVDANASTTAPEAAAAVVVVEVVDCEAPDLYENRRGDST